MNDRGDSASQITLQNIDCADASDFILFAHDRHEPWAEPLKTGNALDPYYCTVEKVSAGGGGRADFYKCRVGLTVIQWLYEASE